MKTLILTTLTLFVTLMTSSSAFAQGAQDVSEAGSIAKTALSEIIKDEDAVQERSQEAPVRNPIKIKKFATNPERV